MRTAVIHIMRHAVHRHVGAVDGDTPSVIGASMDILCGDRGKRTAAQRQRFRGNGTDTRSGDPRIIPDDRCSGIHGVLSRLLEKKCGNFCLPKVQKSEFP